MLGLFSEGGEAPTLAAWIILLVLAAVIVPACWGALAFFGVVMLGAKVCRAIGRRYNIG
jgi:hypothetical protein